MSRCTPVIPSQADADESFLSGGLSSNMAPHRFLLGHVSFAQLPPDHPCFVTTEVVFQATHSWDLKDCQNHNCCFIFQWLWKKATAWIECSELVPAQFVVYYFSYAFYCFLGNWFFFSMYHLPLNSLILKWKEERKKN